jgi:hypothetical protein
LRTRRVIGGKKDVAGRSRGEHYQKREKPLQMPDPPPVTPELPGILS